jgi:hypothetical protein
MIWPMLYGLLSIKTYSGSGLILLQKAFQKPFEEGVSIIL